jgi:penicillin-binding protein 1A
MLYWGITLLKKLLIGIIALFFVGIGVVVYTVQNVRSTLPKLITVEDYKPLLVSQVYDRNGKKIGEFFRERRTLVPYSKIPKDLVNAFLAAEDDQFFKHQGINYTAIIRAFVANMRAGRTVQGGSTITQQVAKTLLLTPEKTLTRKVREAMLAQMMEDNLKKEDILYLYLNQIYFGQGAYGIATAAETYFRKTVDKLTLPEMAILAGLPQAPSRYSPVSNPQRAKDRQTYVLSRMADVGFIAKDVADKAVAEPVTVYVREKYQTIAPFALETIRLILVDQIGEETLLDKGVSIHTSFDIAKQKEAQASVIRGLKSLDKRQGFRGPLGSMTDPKEVAEFLLKTRNKLLADLSPERIIQPDGKFKDYGPLQLVENYEGTLPEYLKLGSTVEGIVSKVDDTLGLVHVRFAEYEGLIDIETMSWARKPDPEAKAELTVIKKPSEALQQGDKILVRLASAKFSSDRLNKLKTTFTKQKKSVADFPIADKFVGVELDQDPTVEGSLVSLDQETQDVLAIVGGYDFEKSEFNRALQAARQTGSSFKAIVYAAALDKGYTPSTPIMDAPIVYEEQNTDAEGQEDTKIWKPANHSKSFGGDIIFRNALVKSLNVPTVKIIEDITVPWAADYARRLGVFSPLNMDFTLALGSSGVTLYELTKAFAVFGRLGKYVKPVIVHKVVDREGKPLLGKISLDERFKKEIGEYEQQFTDRRKAFLEAKAAQAEGAEGSPIKDSHFFFEEQDQLIKPTTAYVMTTLLKSVVEDKHGTGGRARAIGREVAGKTGTTNGYFDAWFVGYTPQIATGVWVGFDTEKSIGKGEVGGRAALPIWVDYMKAAHEGLPLLSFPTPNGIVFANIDAETGKLASASSRTIIRQAFVEGTEPGLTSNKTEENSDFYKQDMSE